MDYVKPARLHSPLLLGTQGTRLEEAEAQEDNPDHTTTDVDRANQHFLYRDKGWGRWGLGDLTDSSGENLE